MEIEVSSTNIRTMDDILKFVHHSIDAWSPEERAVFYLRFTKEFGADMRRCITVLPKGGRHEEGTH